MYNAFTKLKHEHDDKIQRGSLSRRRQRNKSLIDARNSTLVLKSIERRENLQSIIDKQQMYLREQVEENLAQSIVNHKFRSRDRLKEIKTHGTDQQFKVSDYENTQQRVERVINESKKAILLNKGRFDEKDKILVYRKDDKTLMDPRGFTHTARNELDRIKDIIKQRRKFERDQFDLKFMNSQNIYRDFRNSMKYRSQQPSPLKTHKKQQNSLNVSQNFEPFYQHNFQHELSQQIKLKEPDQKIEANKQWEQEQGVQSLSQSKLKHGMSKASISIVSHNSKVFGSVSPRNVGLISNRHYQSIEKFQKLQDIISGGAQEFSPRLILSKPSNKKLNVTQGSQEIYESFTTQKLTKKDLESQTDIQLDRLKRKKRNQQTNKSLILSSTNNITGNNLMSSQQKVKFDQSTFSQFQNSFDKNLNLTNQTLMQSSLPKNNYRYKNESQNFKNSLQSSQHQSSFVKVIEEGQTTKAVSPIDNSINFDKIKIYKKPLQSQILSPSFLASIQSKKKLKEQFSQNMD